MDFSRTIALILAITYISTGFAALSGQLTYEKLKEDLLKSPALAYLCGFFAVAFGVVIIQNHNIWVANWRVLVTMVGWLSLIKGIVLMAFPQCLSAFKGWYKNSRAWGGVMLILGLMFGYFGLMGG